MTARADRPVLVWVAGVSWDGIRATDRHLAAALTRHARVLWVDPPVSPATPARYRGTAGRLPRPHLSTAQPGLVRLTPVALPGLTRPGLRATTWPLVRQQVRWALRRLGPRPYAVVVSSLDDVLGRFGSGVRNVLFGTDDYVAGAELMGQPADRLREQERRALSRADTVMVVSPELRDRWLALRRRLDPPGPVEPVVIPNGCDLAGYAEVDTAPLPPGIDLPAPVVGMVGQLSDRIDLDLLAAPVDAGLSLLLVGPHDERWEQRRFAELTARPGVHYAGQVPAEALAGYLRLIDVGITPYRDSSFNRASFPLKTLEYLAAGRGVVSTDLPAARWLLADAAAAGIDPAGTLSVAPPGQLAFAAAVQAAAEVSGPPELVARRRAFAARHSWQRRAAAFAAAIGLPAADPVAVEPPAGQQSTVEV